MSLWSKIRGTIETIFQLGLNGPNLKNNGGAIEGRNSGDTAFTVVRGDTPVAANDLTTKAYVDATVMTGSIREIRMPITTSASQSSAVSIPANAVIAEATVKITTAYDVGTIAVGRTGSTSLLVGATDNLPTAIGSYQIEQDTTWGASALPVLVTITGSPTTGAGFVIVKYAVPDV
jgi:hypothetical protein